jgi:hypothetical protein
MIAIDEMKAASLHATTPQEADPITRNEDGCVWTLGMVIPMWAYLYGQSAEETCGRGIAF